jgi:hypothetical protein
MKLNCRRSVGILIVLSISCLASMRSTASAANLPLYDDSPCHSTNGFDLDSPIEVPVMNAPNPEAARQRWNRRLPWDPPILREREAILSNPMNGYELVDRVMAPGDDRMIAIPAQTRVS